MTLYRSHLPGHSPEFSSPQPVFGVPGAQQAPVVSSAAVPELAAGTPPPSQVSTGVEWARPPTRPFVRFARDDSDSEDGLDSPEEVGLRWNDVFEDAFSA